MEHRLDVVNGQSTGARDAASDDKPELIREPLPQQQHQVGSYASASYLDRLYINCSNPQTN